MCSLYVVQKTNVMLSRKQLNNRLYQKTSILLQITMYRGKQPDSPYSFVCCVHCLVHVCKSLCAQYLLLLDLQTPRLLSHTFR